MIIFVSDGRLGNQIFQYVFLQTIASKKEKVIAFNMHNFINVFDFKSSNFIAPSLSNLSKRLLFRIGVPLANLFSKARLISCIEQKRVGNKSLTELNKTKGLLPITYVKTGFFQSEFFFKKDAIDFNFKKSDIKKAQTILNAFSENEIAFVHVRRGDYLNENYSGVKGINLPKEYYIHAMDKLSMGMKNPFFIFLTDDYDYVRSCFEEIDNKFISQEPMMVDLAIMTLCQFGVASNSSFSWWGAQLMQSKKNVIFPKYWYGWKTKQESHHDIQPSWGLISEEGLEHCHK